MISRGEPRRVSREERCFANVMEATEELNDALEAETCSRMHWSTVLKRIDVVFDLLDRDAHGLGPLSKHCWVMNTLSSARDLLTTHEKVVRVCVVGVSWVNHGIEGPCVDRVPVQHVEVSVVLGPHQCAKCFLRRRRQVFKRLLLNSCLMQHGNALLEADSGARVRDLEILKRILFINRSQLACISRLDVLDHVDHELADQVEHLEVVILELHLHVEARELAQVPISVRVLCTEDWTNFEYTLQVAH